MAHWALEHHGKPTYKGALANQVVARSIRLALCDIIRRNLRTRQRGGCTVIYNKLGWGWREDLPPPEGGTAKVIPLYTPDKNVGYPRQKCRTNTLRELVKSYGYHSTIAECERTKERCGRGSKGSKRARKAIVGQPSSFFLSAFPSAPDVARRFVCWCSEVCEQNAALAATVHRPWVGLKLRTGYADTLEPVARHDPSVCITVG